MGGGKDIRRGLEPLEFEECIVDSPEFRDNLNRHEKELDHTSHQIKRIIKEVKDLMSAAKGPTCPTSPTFFTCPTIINSTTSRRTPWAQPQTSTSTWTYRYIG
ncbi:hypothetical protein ACLKA7_006724 [Drosophila subpalustris]